jgi:hypothetical protein
VRAIDELTRALKDVRDLLLRLAQVIVRALQALPKDLPAELVERAEAKLVTDADDFGPRELRCWAGGSST